MKSNFASALVTAGIVGASLILGILAGTVVWGTIVNVAARGDEDPTNLVFAMFDSRAFIAGLITTLITTLLVASLLSWGWRALSDRGRSS